MKYLMNIDFLELNATQKNTFTEGEKNIFGKSLPSERKILIRKDLKKTLIEKKEGVFKNLTNIRTEIQQFSNKYYERRYKVYFEFQQLKKVVRYTPAKPRGQQQLLQICKDIKSKKIDPNIFFKKVEKEYFTIFTHPRKGTSQYDISKHNCLIHIENFVFYSSEEKERVLFFLKANFEEINFISRLDIAVDFQQDTSFMNTVCLSMFENPKLFHRNIKKVYAVNDISKYKNVFDVWENEKIYSVRAGRTKVQRIYNKTFELSQKPKSHITKQHTILADIVVYKSYYKFNHTMYKNIDQLTKAIINHNKHSFVVSFSSCANITRRQQQHLLHKLQEQTKKTIEPLNVYRVEVEAKKVVLKKYMVNTWYEILENINFIFFDLCKIPFVTENLVENPIEYLEKKREEKTSTNGFVSARNTLKNMVECFKVLSSEVIKEGIKEYLQSLDNEVLTSLNTYYQRKINKMKQSDAEIYRYLLTDLF